MRVRGSRKINDPAAETVETLFFAHPDTAEAAMGKLQCTNT